MDFLKKETAPTGKRQPPAKPQNVYYFCNACGNKFKVERADARFCSDICRSAAGTVAKNIITVPANLTIEDAARYDAIVLKLKDDKGTVIRALFENDGAGIFTRVKKELTRTGDEETDKATESAEEKAQIAKAAEKGAKIPDPKNDKRLLEGDTGKADDRVIKKRKKASKKKKGGSE